MQAKMVDVTEILVGRSSAEDINYTAYMELCIASSTSISGISLSGW